MAVVAELNGRIADRVGNLEKAVEEIRGRVQAIEERLGINLEGSGAEGAISRVCSTAGRNVGGIAGIDDRVDEELWELEEKVADVALAAIRRWVESHPEHIKHGHAQVASGTDRIYGVVQTGEYVAMRTDIFDAEMRRYGLHGRGVLSILNRHGHLYKYPSTPLRTSLRIWLGNATYSAVAVQWDSVYR